MEDALSIPPCQSPQGIQVKGQTDICETHETLNCNASHKIIIVVTNSSKISGTSVPLLVNILLAADFQTHKWLFRHSLDCYVELELFFK